MKKKCSRCSADFTCRQDRIDLCGCSDVFLKPGVKDYIKENYGNCLCPQCLKTTNECFYLSGINPRYRIRKEI
ncbi:MAG: cysteine-rich CWC family protein [Dysgonomonas sp.]|nr:cysteine-rich CWC family protein [Dysgonomonas sp.]